MNLVVKERRIITNPVPLLGCSDTPHSDPDFLGDRRGGHPAGDIR